MTAGQFREVDPDLLADYVGGALDGTPDEAVVARLIVDDPAWGEAHASLTEATRSVRSGLAEWGAMPEPMPLEVADRLTAALVEANLRDTAPDVASPQPVTLSAVPGGAGAGRGNRAGDGLRARRGWRRWGAPVAIAAGVAAFAGFGITQLAGPGAVDQGETTASSDAPGQRSGQEQARAAASAPSAGAPQVTPGARTRLVTSGTDYGPSTLSAAGSGSSRDASARPLTAQDTPPDASFAAMPPALRRLADRDALASCLGAVTTAHGHGPLVVDVVDYASFQGAPAVVVAFTNAAAERWVWVAGPQCGRGEAGADTRYSARVG